jgi:hypothetical protein
MESGLYEYYTIPESLTQMQASDIENEIESYILNYWKKNERELK